MPRVLLLSSLIVVAFLVSVSCETTRSITSKMGSITSRVDEDLFAQVPEQQRGDVDQAALTLMVSEEEVKLAEMKTELATVRRKYARYQEDLANKLHKEAALGLDIAKLEAIDRSGLGDKDDNARKIADLKSNRLETEAQRVKIEAQLATAKRHIRGLTKQIAEKAKEIEGLKTGEVRKEKETEGPETGEGEPSQ
jgi:chromosome segregation ATPase